MFLFLNLLSYNRLIMYIHHTIVPKIYRSFFLTYLSTLQKNQIGGGKKVYIVPSIKTYDVAPKGISPYVIKVKTIIDDDEIEEKEDKNKKEDDNSHTVIMSVVDDFNKRDCVTVIIHKDGTCILQTLGADTGCGYRLDNNNNKIHMRPSGDLLVEFIIDRLKKLKNDKEANVKIKRILLKDNSILPCSKNPIHKIRLSQLRMIRKNVPWYMSHGFRFYNPNTNKPDKSREKDIEYNYNIISTMKINDIKLNNLLKYIQTYKNQNNISNDIYNSFINEYKDAIQKIYYLKSL